MLEKLQAKIEKLRQDREELERQKVSVQSTLDATYGALQICEILLKEIENEGIEKGTDGNDNGGSTVRNIANSKKSK